MTQNDTENKYAALAATAAALGAAWLMRKTLESSWVKLTGREAPENPESDETTWGEALAWAVVSGAALGVARLVARRGTISTMSKATGRRSLEKQVA